MAPREIANEPPPPADPGYWQALEAEFGQHDVRDEQHHDVGDDEVRTAVRTFHGVPRVAPVAHVAHVGERGGGDALAGLLDEVLDLLGKYVAFPSTHAGHAVAAWVLHTHVLDAFDSTPRLALLSPEKGSGKTRVLEVLELVVPGPQHVVNISVAALAHKINSGRVTILLDEADTYLAAHVAKQHEDLRGIVNAGHRRGATYSRAQVEGKGVKVVDFDTFAPVAMAGIGDLPDTILDRSVAIPMKRRSPGEHVEPFRYRKAHREALTLAEKCAAWGEEWTHALEDVEPDMPDGIVDRPADVWEPLVMIGDHAGPEWSERVRTACVALNEERSRRDPSLGVLLLSDCRTIFDGAVERMTTEQLVERLVNLDESPWGDLRGKPLDARGLARRLRPYEVRPGDHRFGEVVKKGYLLEDFHDAWVRYLPSTPGQGQQGQQAQPEADVVDLDEYESRFPELFEGTR